MPWVERPLQESTGFPHNPAFEGPAGSSNALADPRYPERGSGD